eukprot:g7161.t1
MSSSSSTFPASEAPRIYKRPLSQSYDGAFFQELQNYMQEYFPPISSSNSTMHMRSSRKHMYNDSKTGQYSRAAQAQCDKLPEHLRDISYKAEFKNELKAYLLQLQQS